MSVVNANENGGNGVPKNNNIYDLVFNSLRFFGVATVLCLALAYGFYQVLLWGAKHVAEPLIEAHRANLVNEADQRKQMVAEQQKTTAAIQSLDESIKTRDEHSNMMHERILQHLDGRGKAGEKP